ALARPSTSEETRDAVFARCEAGETVSLADVQRVIAESKAAREAKVSLSPPTPPKRLLTNADLIAAVERSVAQEIARGLRDLAFQFSRCPQADKLVEKLSADEREEAREGIETAMRIKAALDKLRDSQVVTVSPNRDRR